VATCRYVGGYWFSSNACSLWCITKSKIDFKLGLITVPVVSANGQPLDIKGKCVLEIFLGGVTVFHLVLVAADVMQHCFLGIDFWASIIVKLILTPKRFKLAERLWQDFDQNVYIFVFPKSYTSGTEECYAECFSVNIALFHC